MEKGEAKAENRRYLTTQEVADILRVRVETVRSYIKQGKLPAVKLGRDYRIAAEDVDQLLRPRLGETRVAYRTELQIQQSMPEIGPAVAQLPDEPAGEPAEAGAKFDVWAITEQLNEQAPPYDPEADQRIEELFREIGPEIRRRYPTIKDFMESTRGRGNYDPD